MQNWDILINVVQLLNKHSITRVSLFDQLCPQDLHVDASG